MPLMPPEINKSFARRSEQHRGQYPKIRKWHAQAARRPKRGGRQQVPADFSSRCIESAQHRALRAHLACSRCRYSTRTCRAFFRNKELIGGTLVASLSAHQFLQVLGLSSTL